VPLADIPPKGTSAEKRSLAESALSKVVAEIAGPNPDSIQAVEESFYIPSGILEYARKNQIDLIVMGTHGRRGFRRHLLGSVAEEIVRKSPCPVLTIGADQSLEPQRPRKILGAVDLEESTEQVVATVKSLAELYHADMSFVHVVPPISYLDYTSYGSPMAIDRGETLARAETLMKKHMKSFGITGENAELTVAQGIPDAEIVELARKEEVDMIVVATHSRVGLPHVLLGSVADRVLRTADCPVLTILGGARKQLAA
jgi:nucleotide-binding universal stress UspA family protein